MKPIPRSGPYLSVALLAAALAGCATLRLLTYRPARLPRCPGALVSSERIPGEFVSRLRMQITAPEVAVGYDLVLQKKGRRLVLIGLTRFGAKAFSVVQDGRELSVESALGPATVVPPENVLRDIHRARFLSAGAPIESGEVERRIDGERVRDEWREGVLRSREIIDEDGRVTLDYIDRREIHIHNQRCGYEAVLVDLGADSEATDSERPMS